MANEFIEISPEEAKEPGEETRRPVCPLCTSPLENAEDVYIYKRLNPDTRWFWCDTCASHLGYHRMKGRWRVPQEDFDPVLLEGNGRP